MRILNRRARTNEAILAELRAIRKHLERVEKQGMAEALRRGRRSKDGAA